MKHCKKRIIALLLVTALMLCCLPAGIFAADNADLQKAVALSAAYMQKAVKDPQPGTVGGEWAILGLARSGIDVPDTYYQGYYSTVEEYVKACDGVLHEKKYTDYSRMILGVSAIGKDARNVAGYDLTKALGDYDKTIWQGLNGPIWALIALDSRNYPMPVNPEAKTQATRQMYIDCILSRQLPDGGWSLTGGTDSAAAGDQISDPDITGMALQALSKYMDQPAVAKAVEEALNCMSSRQNADGGFGTWGVNNCESAVQILVGLCELGIAPDDPRFVKNGISVLDNIFSYRTSAGGFRHTADGSGNNQMTAEQGFYGIVAALRLQEGKNSLYSMSDCIRIADTEEQQSARGTGLPGKDPAVQSVPITSPGTTFEDAELHDNVAAIEAMAARGILTGYPDGTFRPERTLTRAEFCAMVTAALGLPASGNNAFADTEGHWASGRIATAYAYGLAAGTGNGKFNPNGTVKADPITRQTAEPDIFVGGDAYSGQKFVVDALAMGREGAVSLHRFVNEGQSLTIHRNTRHFTPLNKDEIVLGVDEYKKPARAVKGVDSAKVRTMRDERLIFTEEQIKSEASRCLGCGRSVVDTNKCLGCGMCTVQCKFDAIHLTRSMGDAYSKMIPAEDKFKAIGAYAAKRSVKILRRKAAK